MSRMKSRYARLAALPLAFVVGLGFAGCRVQKTEDGKAPEVQVKEGKLPKYDVDTAKVEVKKDTVNMDVPKVEVKKDNVQVDVPKVKVTMPPDKPKGTEPPPQQ
ncbi:MAG: hypothetical protein QOJ16_47 [Acidobacteriota bacterium]|nr:hypothetical protein [Acidobacteriota bacterium]